MSSFLSPGILRLFVSMLKSPLSSPTSAGDRTIELVLHLVRNLLMPCPMSSRDRGAAIMAMESEMVLDLVSFVARNLGTKRMQPWNLLILEIVGGAVQGVDPGEVKDGRQRRSSLREARVRKSSSGASATLSSARGWTGVRGPAARHSRFGGTDSSVRAGAAATRRPLNPNAERSRRKNAHTAAFSSATPPTVRLATPALKALGRFAEDFLDRGGERGGRVWVCHCCEAWSACV